MQHQQPLHQILLNGIQTLHPTLRKMFLGQASEKDALALSVEETPAMPVRRSPVFLLLLEVTSDVGAVDLSVSVELDSELLWREVAEQIADPYSKIHLQVQAPVFMVQPQIACFPYISGYGSCAL